MTVAEIVHVGIVVAFDQFAIGGDAAFVGRQGLDVGINQLTTLANSFETVQAGGLTTKRAELANTLEGMGLPSLAKMVMSSDDVAAVQNSS